jgi:Putative zinc-finger
VFSCRRAARLISDGLDRPLSWSERLALAVHLLGCPPCCRFRRAARWLQSGLARAFREVRLPAEAHDRIRRALDRAARGPEGTFSGPP